MRIQTILLYSSYLVVSYFLRAGEHQLFVVKRRCRKKDCLSSQEAYILRSYSGHGARADTSSRQTRVQCRDVDGANTKLEQTRGHGRHEAWVDSGPGHTRSQGRHGVRANTGQSKRGGSSETRPWQHHHVSLRPLKKVATKWLPRGLIRLRFRGSQEEGAGKYLGGPNII